jgi:hypothetical protein
MKQIFRLFLTLLTFTTQGQNMLEWDKDYKLQFSDFQSPSTQIGQTNVYSLYTGVHMDFAFHMSNTEFMFTKNFNSKVNCSLNKAAAYIIATDNMKATELLNFAQYEFDLTELYVRKFRQKMFSNKGAFSNVNFFKPLYDEVQLELSSRHASATKLTDMGVKSNLLNELHQEVLDELTQLADFCKTCKPPKRKK